MISHINYFNSFSKKIILGYFVLLASFLLLGGKAHALVSLSPDPGPIPVAVRNYLENCDAQPNTPAYMLWISPEGDPSNSISVNVPYGYSAAVRMQLNIIGTVCNSTSNTTDADFYINQAVSAPALSFAGVVGAQILLNFTAPVNTVGKTVFVSAPFTVLPTTGSFTASSDYTFNMGIQAINKFTNNTFLCVLAPPGNRTNIADFFAPPPCITTFPPFDFRINVTGDVSCAMPGPYNVSPGQTFLIPAGVYMNGDSYSAGSPGGGGQGLHIGLAMAGNPSTWDQPGIPNPPPDMQSVVLALDSGGGQNLYNAGYYVESAGFNYLRYYIPNPNDPNVTIRVQAPAAAGSYTLVMRLLARQTPAWLPNYCTTVINVANPAPTVDLKMNQNGGAYADSLPGVIAGDTLSTQWTSANATSCSATAGPWAPQGGLPTAGTQGRPLSDTAVPGTYTYTITCSGAGGSATDSVVVTITGIPIVVCGGVNPVSAEPGQLINVTVSFTNSGTLALSGATLNVTINGVLYPNVAYAPNPVPFAPPGNVATSSPIAVTMPLIPGSVLVSWVISGGNGAAKSCSATIKISAQPYLKVYGGDVRAGAGFTPFVAGGPCVLGAGKIDAWAPSDSSGRGASTQFGAIATGAITGFASANLRLVVPIPPTGITFANDAGLLFGGNFGTTSCMPNYWVSFMDNPGGASPAFPVNLNPSGQTLHSGGGAGRCNPITNQSAPSCFRLSGTPTTKLTVFVDGDLNIINNVTYGGPWANVNSIPYLTVVVCGNIYINNNVTEIDGWYIAMPRSYCGAAPAGHPGGTIYTCTNGFQLYTTASLYDACTTNVLTIRGSFSADNIKFLRTHGTLNSSVAGEDKNANLTAEKFIYSPESWIVSPVQKITTPNGQVKIDGITGLPPIL